MQTAKSSLNLWCEKWDWIEFESAHELLMNLNSTFAKPMNLNLVFSKSMNLNLKITKKNEWINPGQSPSFGSSIATNSDSMRTPQKLERSISGVMQR